MGSFEWMELQTLTSDINASRSRLAAARANKDNRLVRVLEQEITEAEARRDRLLASITTNLAGAGEAAHNPQSPADEAVQPVIAEPEPAAEADSAAAESPPPLANAAAKGSPADDDSDAPLAAPAPPANRVEGGMVVWDQLTPSDIERAQAELGTRRAEILARHAEELKALEAEQAELETLERAIDMFVRRLNKGAAAGEAQAADIVKLGASAA